MTDTFHPPLPGMLANGDRTATLRTYARVERLVLTLRDGGGDGLTGGAPDMGSASAAARMWLAGAPASEVATAWPFFGSAAMRAARERGDLREWKWHWFYENPTGDTIPGRLHAFAALAFHAPRLRALTPYTSHFMMRLSDSTTEPLRGAHRYPAVEPILHAEGRFVVHTPDGLVHDETDAAGALRIVLAGLPDQ